MPAKRVTLTVTYEAEVDGELCGEECAHLDVDYDNGTWCDAFDQPLDLHGAHWNRCGSCLYSERQERTGRDG